MVDQVIDPNAQIGKVGHSDFLISIRSTFSSRCLRNDLGYIITAFQHPGRES